MTILISTIIICRTWSRSIDAKHRELSILESKEINKDTFDTTMTLVDKILEDIFVRYTIMNTESKDDLYMNEEMINKMMFEVLKEAYTTLSTQIMNKLTSIYNSSYVDDMIAKKVQLMTMNYVISVNGTYKK